MNPTLVDKIVQAVLYEGYILYPYRPSVKNHQRWTFGGLYPESSPLAVSSDEPSVMQTQCLVAGTPRSMISVEVRFLHLIVRTVGELRPPLAAWPPEGEPAFAPVASLRVGQEIYHTWQEAEERRIALDARPLSELLAVPRRHRFTLPPRREIEPLPSEGARIVGLLLREQEALAGTVELSAEQKAPGIFQLTVRIINRTPVDGQARLTRDQAAMAALVSTHTVLGVGDGEFVSLMDPPQSCKAIAAQCRNVGAWPVLVGQGSEKDAMLSSPITLYDYPQIAPESPGGFFDSTEIDEILSLRILTLTDEEKQSMAGVDARARALLDRTESLPGDQFMGLHGTLRGMKPSSSPVAQDDPFGSWDPPRAGPPLTSVRVAGVELKAGDRVRLRPRRRADVMDIALRGKAATITSIEQDYEDQVHVVVTIDDDPGKEWALGGGPGHRFFFGLDEIELPDGEPEGQT